MIASIEVRIAQELSARPEQVAAAVKLLDEGSTVPFIARYRKEATGGLDDTQLRTLEERLVYLRELEERRAAIVASIEEQGKMTPELHKAIAGADTKQVLEDLYLPYRQKRRTKAMIAREAGLEPLAKGLLADPTQRPDAFAAAFVSAEKGVADVAQALEGARFILMEDFAEDAELLARLRTWVEKEALVSTQVGKGKEEDPEAQRYRDYFRHDEPLARMPSHRALAIFRARKEGFLDACLAMAVPDSEVPAPLGDDPNGRGQLFVMERFGIADKGRPADKWLADTARLAWKAKLALHLESEQFATLRERAEVADGGRGIRRDRLHAAPGAGGRRQVCPVGPQHRQRTTADAKS